MEHLNLYEIALSILKALTVMLGVLFLFITWRAYRKHKARQLLVLLMAVGTLTLSAIVEGAAVQFLGLSLDQSHVIEGVFTLAAFAILVWSVVTPTRRRTVAPPPSELTGPGPDAP